MMSIAERGKKTSSRKYYYFRRPIGDPSETHRRPTSLIGYLNMLHRRLTGLIGDLDMLHRRPTCLIGAHRRPRHAKSKTLTCYIGDRHDLLETHQRPQHASLETNMPDRRPIKDLDMLHRRPTCLIGDPYA